MVESQLLESTAAERALLNCSAAERALLTASELPLLEACVREASVHKAYLPNQSHGPRTDGLMDG